MSDTSSARVWFNDLPVRDIPENLAMLERNRKGRRLSHEQRVALVYGSVIMRVLLEQCERYYDLHHDLLEEGSSFDLLRELALERARIIAELLLSARREGVDLSEHAVPGHDPLAALMVLGVIRSCDVLLTDDDPDRQLLLTDDELDMLLHGELMDTWWKNILPRDEIAPPPFGEGAPLPMPPPTDRATAEAAVRAIAVLLTASIDDYRALLGEHAAGGASSERALRRARAITRIMQANFKRNLDFGVLDDALRPVAAGVVLTAVADSCVVLAAPEGDFDRYGMTAAELEEMLADPELRSWSDAVGQLS